MAIGRAIVREPKVFLFDEPLSNLDAALRVQMRIEIAKLHERLAATMIYVTHDQVEAMTMGDRIVVLDGGRIQQIDSPLDLYASPANRFVAGFIGSPAMNFVPGVLGREDGLRFRATDDAFTLPILAERARDLAGYEDGEVILGIRPEDISVAGNPRTRAPVAEATLSLDVLEPMGNEIFLHARSHGHRLLARVAPQALPEPGSTITVAFDLTKLHFFDPRTERALGTHGRLASPA